MLRRWLWYTPAALHIQGRHFRRRQLYHCRTGGTTENENDQPDQSRVRLLTIVSLKNCTLFSKTNITIKKNLQPERCLTER